jgi:hypothetical protein
MFNTLFVVAGLGLGVGVANLYGQSPVQITACSAKYEAVYEVAGKAYTYAPPSRRHTILDLGSSAERVVNYLQTDPQKLYPFVCDVQHLRMMTDILDAWRAAGWLPTLQQERDAELANVRADLDQSLHAYAEAK